MEKILITSTNLLFTARQNVLNILQKNMQGHDDQLSIAEALLIGYTEDLDKDLVQAYSNTGVVHIIAISGMHLALIYVMLVWIFNKIPFVKRSKIIKVIFILSCLWFSLYLPADAASVLRSAVMFSCIVIGRKFCKEDLLFIIRLAASAFILLCYNPYFLWDVGFQLSYLAVLGIVIFQKPIYHLFYIKNKWVDKFGNWRLFHWLHKYLLSHLSLLFSPVSNIFLFTNLIMVPLSSLILFVEIFLVAFSWIPFVGVFIGKLTWWLVWLMNKIILWFNELAFCCVGQDFSICYSTMILYAFVICVGSWLLNKNKTAFQLSLFLLLAFTCSNQLYKMEYCNAAKNNCV